MDKALLKKVDTIHKQPRQRDKLGVDINKFLRKRRPKEMKNFNPVASTDEDFEGLDERLAEAQDKLFTARFMKQVETLGMLELNYTHLVEETNKYFKVRVGGAVARLPKDECSLDPDKKTVRMPVLYAKQLGLV